MENWQASAAVIWMFCPPGLDASHMIENYAYEGLSNTMLDNGVPSSKKGWEPLI